MELIVTGRRKSVMNVVLALSLVLGVVALGRSQWRAAGASLSASALLAGTASAGEVRRSEFTVHGVPYASATP